MIDLLEHKKIFIINGRAGVGKDKFVQLVSKYAKVVNYSSVQSIKDLARIYFGYDENIKSDKDRKFLADLKELTTKYCNFSFNETINTIDLFLNSNNKEIMFIHCREPEEIKKIKEAVPSCKTILILADNRVIKKVDNNYADRNTDKFNYDIILHNDSTIEALDDIAEQFVNNLRDTKPNTNE